MEFISSNYLGLTILFWIEDFQELSTFYWHYITINEKGEVNREIHLQILIKK